MTSAKDIILKPIASKDATRLVQAFHYSGRVVQNSQLHFGVFLEGRCGGVISLGPPMMRKQVLGLVRGTQWSEMIELNRMAFADWLPRNSESRAMSVAFRLIRKSYTHIKWILSYADGVQCGDGTIYRAAGFVLTAISKSDQIRELADGTRVTRFSLTKNVKTMKNGGASAAVGKAIPGFMFRYVYFLHPQERANLAVPEIPYARIGELGLHMYKGIRAGSAASGTPAIQAGGDGAEPIPALHSPGE